MPRGAKKHRRMSIVPTGVHLAGYGRFIRPLHQLGHGERIHIGA